MGPRIPAVHQGLRRDVGSQVIGTVLHTLSLVLGLLLTLGASFRLGSGSRRSGPCRPKRKAPAIRSRSNTYRASTRAPLPGIQGGREHSTTVAGDFEPAPLGRRSLTDLPQPVTLLSCPERSTGRSCQPS